MKNFFENIQKFMKSEDNQTYKTIGFFAFYIFFFAILFSLIHFKGDRNYLLQEYEKGDSSVGSVGVLNKNYVYDFKITLDGVLHDYYGKRYEDKESFKYNNLDYYRDADEFFVNQDMWIKCENPYLFYEFLDYENLTKILEKATFVAKTEYENGKVVHHYIISSNDLAKLWTEEETDYGEDTDTIDIEVGEDNNITKIQYGLDHYCMHRELCSSSLSIDMSFEMFGSVTDIENPIE